MPLGKPLLSDLYAMGLRVWDFFEEQSVKPHYKTAPRELASLATGIPTRTLTRLRAELRDTGEIRSRVPGNHSVHPCIVDTDNPLVRQATSDFIKLHLGKGDVVVWTMIRDEWVRWICDCRY